MKIVPGSPVLRLANALWPDRCSLADNDCSSGGSGSGACSSSSGPGYNSVNAIVNLTGLQDDDPVTEDTIGGFLTVNQARETVNRWPVLGPIADETDLGNGVLNIYEAGTSNSLNVIGSLQWTIPENVAVYWAGKGDILLLASPTAALSANSTVFPPFFLTELRP